MEKEFNVEMLDQCQSCGEIREVNELNDCVICWHNKISIKFPHICKSEGTWKAFETRDEMPTPPGNW